MSTHIAVTAKRLGLSRHALKAAHLTLQHASMKAMAAAFTPARQQAVAEATEIGLAAIVGMRRALDPDWLT